MSNVEDIIGHEFPFVTCMRDDWAAMAWHDLMFIEVIMDELETWRICPASICEWHKMAFGRA
jgi:hypothetical protein